MAQPRFPWSRAHSRSGVGQHSLKPGDRLEKRFFIHRFLADGPGWETYLAEDTHQKSACQCVVKCVALTQFSESELIRHQFKAECAVFSQLRQDRRIPALISQGNHQNFVYLVRELVDGQSLATELIPQHSWTEESLVQLLQEMLHLLAFLHCHNWIHRDVQPQNFVRCRHDGRLMLVDFGGVTPIVEANLSEAIILGNPVRLAMGTPGYIPAEQAQGHARPCSDLYGLGVIAIQALTGMAVHQLHRDPDSGELQWSSNAVSADMQDFVRYLSAYHFKDRFATAIAALETLETKFNLPSRNFAQASAPLNFPSVGSGTAIVSPGRTFPALSSPNVPVQKSPTGFAPPPKTASGSKAWVSQALVSSVLFASLGTAAIVSSPPPEDNLKSNDSKDKNTDNKPTSRSSAQAGTPPGLNASSSLASAGAQPVRQSMPLMSHAPNPGRSTAPLNQEGTIAPNTQVSKAQSHKTQSPKTQPITAAAPSAPKSATIAPEASSTNALSTMGQKLTNTLMELIDSTSPELNASLSTNGQQPGRTITPVVNASKDNASKDISHTKAEIKMVSDTPDGKTIAYSTATLIQTPQGKSMEVNTKIGVMPASTPMERSLEPLPFAPLRPSQIGPVRDRQIAPPVPPLPATMPMIITKESASSTTSMPPIPTTNSEVREDPKAHAEVEFEAPPLPSQLPLTANELVTATEPLPDDEPVSSSQLFPETDPSFSDPSADSLSLQSAAVSETVDSFTAQPWANPQAVITPDGQQLVGTCPGNCIKIWDVETGQHLCTLASDKPIAGIAISADGQHVIADHTDQSTSRWDLSTGTPIY